MNNVIKWASIPCFMIMVSAPISAEEKSIGGKVSYNFAHGACESDSSDCDDDSFGGGIYFRHNLFDPYFYQITAEYLGQYTAQYPALNGSGQNVDYDADIYGLGLSAGRVFELSEAHAIVGQVGVMPWYVETKGKEPTGTVKQDDMGVSPFASIAYQYQMNRSSAFELGYQYVYGVGTDETGGSDISQVFLNFAYRFGQTEEQPQATPQVISDPVESQDPVTTTVIEKSMTIDFTENNSTVIFAFDSDQLNPQMYPLLEPMEKRLKDNPQAQLEIESHTDNTGSEDYNLRLSQRRGDNLKAYFVEKGIDEQRITVKPYGESKPLVPNSSAENRATNRRVVLFSPSFSHQSTDVKEVSSTDISNGMEESL